jgi:hypothetical protein
MTSDEEAGGEAVIEVRDLRKSYGDLVAVEPDQVGLAVGRFRYR